MTHVTLGHPCSMASFDLYLGQLFERPEEPLTTPFEDWCREHAIHPEAWGAWERFELDQARTAAKAG